MSILLANVFMAYKSLFYLVLATMLISCGLQAPKPSSALITDNTLAQPLSDLPLESIPEDVAKLDVGIVAFELGIPPDATSHRRLGIFPLVRKAESRYLPFLLRRTLEQSKQWGVVRVMPKNNRSSELVIQGRIQQSNGVVLAVHIKAEDSTGRLWVDKLYSHTVGEEAYQRGKQGDKQEEKQQTQEDPFQTLFTQIANDLLVARGTLSSSQLRSVAEIATLRYGADMSPEAFAPFLVKNKQGVYEVRRLPAKDDPMLGRIKRIRNYEYLFIDTTDEQYQVLFREMQTTYKRWRQYSRELSLYIEDYQRRAANKDHEFRRGTFGSMTDTYGNYEWFRRQEQHMEELAGGFNNEVVPTVMELDDSVVKLSGDIDSQYQRWRSILKSLFELERQPAGLQN